MNHVKTFDPCILLGDRLGLTLYGMFVEAYLQGNCKNEAEMYEKFIQYFPGERGIHTPDAFIHLIDSIRSNGFNPYYPVSANPDEYAMKQGSHRCSIAIQLGIKEVPYILRFDDSRTDDSVFQKVFNSAELRLLEEKREEYVERCDQLTALKCGLRVHMRSHVKSYQAPFSSKTRIPTLRFYQGYEPLGLLGKRPAQKRLEIYNLKRYVRPPFAVLEPGCNVGFFALALSQHVASIQGFEVDPSYVHVANQVAAHCHITNCFFTVDSVDRFQAHQGYDLVISTAVHGWSQLPFAEYVQRIDLWTKPGGLILFESHEIDAEKDWPDKKALLVNRFQLLEQGFIDDVDNRVYESEMREFLLLRKHQG
jgi:SAM-dependent methyltransferase